MRLPATVPGGGAPGSPVSSLGMDGGCQTVVRSGCASGLLPAAREQGRGCTPAHCAGAPPRVALPLAGEPRPPHMSVPARCSVKGLLTPLSPCWLGCLSNVRSFTHPGREASAALCEIAPSLGFAFSMLCFPKQEFLVLKPPSGPPVSSAWGCLSVLLKGGAPRCLPGVSASSSR